MVVSAQLTKRVLNCCCSSAGEAANTCTIVRTRTRSIAAAPRTANTCPTSSLRSNAGVYVKLGQMIAVLQHLVPVKVLKCAHQSTSLNVLALTLLGDVRPLGPPLRQHPASFVLTCTP